MRKSWSLLTVLLLAGPALADPAPVYRAETEQHAASMFDRADKNHDGVMTMDEYVAASVAIAKARGGTPTPRGIAMVEAQFDAAFPSAGGKVSRAEFLAEKMAQFDSLDLNHDGIVSANESRKAATRLREKVKAERNALKSRP